jgi:hypothetical protein
MRTGHHIGAAQLQRPGVGVYHITQSREPWSSSSVRQQISTTPLNLAPVANRNQSLAVST